MRYKVDKETKYGIESKSPTHEVCTFFVTVPVAEDKQHKCRVIDTHLVENGHVVFSTSVRRSDDRYKQGAKEVGVEQAK